MTKYEVYGPIRGTSLASKGAQNRFVLFHVLDQKSDVRKDLPEAVA